MRSPFVVLAALSALLGACKESEPRYPGDPAGEIAEACALTERKCTACHDRERFVVPRHSPAIWRDIVDKMRLFPGSRIAPTDVDTILRCLNYRSSATSLDMSTPLPTSPTSTEIMVTRRSMSAAQRGEVQAMHFGLHKPLHID